MSPVIYCKMWWPSQWKVVTSNRDTQYDGCTEDFRDSSRPREGYDVTTSSGDWVFPNSHQPIHDRPAEDQESDRLIQVFEPDLYPSQDAQYCSGYEAYNLQFPPASKWLRKLSEHYELASLTNNICSKQSHCQIHDDNCRKKLFSII